MAAAPHGEPVLKQAVLLVGGLGTRLKDRTRNTPKPLLEIGGRPFIEYLLDEVARHGFTEIVLLAGHLGDQVESQYEGKAWRGATIRVLREPQPLGTGGALRFALPSLEENFLLGNGDSFFDINLRALPLGLPPGNMAMALRGVANDTRYGRVGLSGGLVRTFHTAGQSSDGPINAGIYVMSRALVQRIPEGVVSFESTLLPDLAREGLIQGRQFDGYFIDIGVPDDFERADTELAHHLRRPAVFFDRDGVLNQDHNYVHRREDFKWIDGAKDAIRWCNDHGVLVFVVTNQAGVAHGLYDETAIHALHGWIAEDLAVVGAHIDMIEYCPHHPVAEVVAYRRDCRRRKPQSGMISDILAKWPVDHEHAFLIGDKQSDLSAAQSAGISAHLFTSGDLQNFLVSRREDLGMAGKENT